MIASCRSGYYAVRASDLCEIFVQAATQSYDLYSAMAKAYKRLKHFLFGRPLPSERLEHERLNKKTALAVLSSDAISSVAYATDQILIVLAVLVRRRQSSTRCRYRESSSACWCWSDFPIAKPSLRTRTVAGPTPSPKKTWVPARSWSRPLHY